MMGIHAVIDLKYVAISRKFQVALLVAVQKVVSAKHPQCFPDSLEVWQHAMPTKQGCPQLGSIWGGWATHPGHRNWGGRLTELQRPKRP